MEYKIFNISYRIEHMVYSVATVSDEDEGNATSRLERHLKKGYKLGDKNLDFYPLKVFDTGVKASEPRVLNSTIIQERRGRLDASEKKDNQKS